MDSTNDNESDSPFVFNGIKYILYFIGFIIVIITFLAIINYLLYAIYYIKELLITTEDIYDVSSLRLNDILNYRLINYIKIFNPKNEKKINLSDNKCYNLKKLMYVSEDTQHPYILANITAQADKDKILETDFTEIIDNFKYNGDGGELKNIKAARGDVPAILKILNKDTTSDISSEIKNYLLDKFPKNIILQNFEYNKLTDKDIKKILDSIKAKGKDQQHSSNDFFYIKYKFIDLQDIKKEKDYCFKFKLQELTTQKEKNEINFKLYNESILAINSSLYDDIKNEDKYSKKGAGNNNYLQIKGKDGIVGYFNIDIEDSKSNDFSRDVFGHVLNRSYLLFPHNLFNSYDKDASNLYITANNKLYEMIFAMIFVIFLIIFILFTIDIIYAIFINKDSGDTTYYMSNLVKEKHYYLLIIPIIIIIYCMIHSIIYYNIFIKKAYVKIIELYNRMIKPDEYLRDIIIKLFGKNIESLNKGLLNLLQDISYAGEIDTDKGKYIVIDLSNEEKNIQLKQFESNMLDINKHFNYLSYNYEANYYTKVFFEDFKKLFDTIGEEKSQERFYLILILSVYIYIVQWNTEDPYILMKLNKLLFGRVANIGIKEIDDEIANTLTIRSIIPYDTTKYIEPKNIESIYDGIATEYLGISTLTEVEKADLTTFKKLFKEVTEYNIERGEYNFNLYLAFDMGLNILTILFILILLKLMSTGDNSEIDKNITYAKMLSSWVVFKVTLAIFGITNIIRFQ
jgi:hypothetical protein